MGGGGGRKALGWSDFALSLDCRFGHIAVDQVYLYKFIAKNSNFFRANYLHSISKNNRQKENLEFSSVYYFFRPPKKASPW